MNFIVWRLWVRALLISEHPQRVYQAVQQAEVQVALQPTGYRCHLGIHKRRSNNCSLLNQERH